MPDLHPRILRVSVSEPADFRSISEATLRASDGDQIVVGPGTYTRGQKLERFPIYVPPHCQLIGAGMDRCNIDGAKDRSPSERPLNPFQSLVLLGDDATISGFTIKNSGGNGISNEQGARVLITRNTIQDNGQHGILVFGTNDAVIQNNRFFNNGTARSLFGGPRPGIGMQGHHVYIETRIGCTNNIAIIGNVMERVFADAISNDMYDQPDGLSMRLQIVENVIRGCGRNGMSIVSSYSPSRTDVLVNIHNNRIERAESTAIDLVSAYSLVNRKISDARLIANVVGNTIVGCSSGILAVGSYEASQNCISRYNIINNTIEKPTKFGIRVVGGYNLDKLEGWEVENALNEAAVAGNRIVDPKGTPMLIQGGAKEKTNGIVRNSIVYAHVVGNVVVVKGKSQKRGRGMKIGRDNRALNNRVVLVEGSDKPRMAKPKSRMKIT